MKERTKYPELQGWFKEGLFVRRQFGGKQWSVGKQMWYVNHLRELFLTVNEVGCIWNIGKVSGGSGIPAMERHGWLYASIFHGFDYIQPADLRAPMRALILAECNPLPSAREVARYSGWAWEQFKYDFAMGLFYMYTAKVGMNGRS